MIPFSRAVTKLKRINKQPEHEMCRFSMLHFTLLKFPITACHVLGQLFIRDNEINLFVFRVQFLFLFANKNRQFRIMCVMLFGVKCNVSSGKFVSFFNTGNVPFILSLSWPPSRLTWKNHNFYVTCHALFWLFPCLLTLFMAAFYPCICIQWDSLFTQNFSPCFPTLFRIDIINKREKAKLSVERKLTTQKSLSIVGGQFLSNA